MFCLKHLGCNVQSHHWFGMCLLICTVSLVSVLSSLCILNLFLLKHEKPHNSAMQDGHLVSYSFSHYFANIWEKGIPGNCIRKTKGNSTKHWNTSELYQNNEDGLVGNTSRISDTSVSNMLFFQCFTYICVVYI